MLLPDDEYEIIQDSSTGNNIETDASRISYNIVPLHETLNRVKRDDQPQVPDKNILNNKQGTNLKKSIWANATRKTPDETAQQPPTGGPVQASTTSINRLLGTNSNQFVNNNASETPHSVEANGTESTDQDSYLFPHGLNPDLAFDQDTDNQSLNLYNLTKVAQVNYFNDTHICIRLLGINGLMT